MTEAARGLLRQARSEIKRAERDLARARRLVAAAADELDPANNGHPQEGHRDHEDEDEAADNRRRPAHLTSAA